MNVTLKISLPETLMKDLRYFALKTGQGEDGPASPERFASEIVQADLAARRLEYVIRDVGDPPILTLEDLLKRTGPAEPSEDVGGKHDNHSTEVAATEAADREGYQSLGQGDHHPGIRPEDHPADSSAAQASELLYAGEESEGEAALCGQDLCLAVIHPRLRAACANERSCGSVRGAISDGCPYRDRQPGRR